MGDASKPGASLSYTKRQEYIEILGEPAHAHAHAAIDQLINPHYNLISSSDVSGGS